MLVTRSTRQSVGVDFVVSLMHKRTKINMKKSKEYEKIIEHLNDRLPEVNEFMNDVTDKLAPFIIDYLRNQSKKRLKSLQSVLNFKLKLVIDNNIIFAEINGLIKGGKNVETCFFYQLAISKVADFYAPPFLREEILEKVEQKFQDEDKPKAKEFAEKLLSTINIREAKWVEDWVKAKRKIGHRDPDDIPYLALFFDLKGHGIMSKDKIFIEEQTDAKVWSIHETGRLSAQFNKGMVSIFCTGNIPNFVSIISDIIHGIVLSVFNFIKKIAKVLFGLAKEGVRYISKLPPELWLILGGLFLAVYLGNEEFKSNVSHRVKNAKEFVLRMVRRLNIWFIRFVEFLKNLYKILKPYAATAGKVFLYLIANSTLIIETIKEIENIDRVI